MIDIGPVHRREYDLALGRSEPVVIGEAPGRIHYLGEHGDPGAGLFLSSAIDRCIRVAVSGRKDASLRFFAPDLGERKRTTLVNLRYKREDRWANYLKIAVQFFADLGVPLKGLNFTVTGDIPAQAGLGSSQAIETAAILALRGFFNVNLGQKALLKKFIASRNSFLGKEASPVDYLALLQAKKDQFLVIDEPGLEVKKIKSPFGRYRILITDSKVPRMGVEEELAQRFQDIKKGRELLARRKPGKSFRDFAPGDLVEFMGNFPEVIRRRSLHVVEELQRVKDAGEALQRPDIPALARIFFHSHESLRDLYEVSCPEVDWLVKRAQEIENAAGSRMTGQGFGGCTYTFIRDEDMEEYKKRLDDYERIFGFHPVIYEVKQATGARIIPG